MTNNFRLAAALLFALPLALPALAQTDPAPSIESITVKAPREPALMPYRVAYDYLEKVEKVPHEKIDVELTLVSRKNGVKPSDVRVWIDASTSIPIPIAADGRFTVPFDRAAYDENAEIVTNQPKGTVGVTLTASLHPPENGTLSYSEIAAAQTQLKDLVRAIFPWY